MFSISSSILLKKIYFPGVVLIGCVVCSTPPHFTFSFRLILMQVVLLCVSVVVAFAIDVLNYFAILTFSPSVLFVRLPSLPFASGDGSLPSLTMASADFWHLMTQSYRTRSLRVSISAFHSCGLCIYSSIPYSIGLLFRMQHHPHNLALYAVSVRRLKRLPPASFRFHLAVDTLALG